MRHAVQRDAVVAQEGQYGLVLQNSTKVAQERNAVFANSVSNVASDAGLSIPSPPAAMPAVAEP